MSEENVIDQLKHIIADELEMNIKLKEIDENISLFEEGIGLDSVTLMEYIVLIEERFGLRFSEEELNIEPFSNLRTLAHHISNKLEMEKKQEGVSLP